MIVHGVETVLPLLPVFGIAPLLIAGAGALLKGVGGVLRKKGQNKKAKASAEAKFQQDKNLWANKENTRTALTRTLLANASARGIRGANVDPALLQEQAFPGVMPPQGVGNTFDMLGDIAGGVGDAAVDYAGYEQGKLDKAGRETEMLRWLCTVNPSHPDCANGSGGFGPNVTVPPVYTGGGEL